MSETLRCPYCDQPRMPTRYGIAFGPQAIRIIDAIEATGRHGVHIKDLFAVVYRERNGATFDTLRSYVSQINRRLRETAVTIRCTRQTYRIAERRRP